MDWFFVVKLAGIGLLVATLAVMPWSIYRPTISVNRRKYDRKIRLAVRLAVPAVVLLAIGVVGQFFR